MELASYIVSQLEGVHDALAGTLSGVSPGEWVASPGPGANPIGFTAWHVPSIQDWAVHTWMQGVPTIRSRPEWVSCGMSVSFLPIGMGLEGARAVAKATEPRAVLDYSAAVLEAARTFVMGLAPEQFDEVPPNRKHSADSRYADAGYHADVDDMYELSYWRLFAGACTGHCRGHLGELELGLALLSA